jgi:preprotein translocase subunit SecF
MEEIVKSAYSKHYKKIVLFPILLFVASLLILSVKYIQTGDIMSKDVSLKGGVSATLEIPGLSQEEVEDYLSQKFSDYSVRELTDFSTRENLGVIIEVADSTEEQLTGYLSKKYSLVQGKNYSITGTGSTFGESFYKDLVVALLFAFLFMAIAVFIIFRMFIPSISVISCAFLDILITIAITSLIGMQISPGGMITYLLIIGYSIDTDILLATRMLKGKHGTLYERMWSSMKTGLGMTGTTTTAVLIGFLFATSPVLKQIFLIMFIAMIVDVIATYAWSAILLHQYCRKKGIN